jgi:4-hydroxyphenylpyruvate dioxygenase
MRRSIATVSLSGMLREKLQAIATAGFNGVEIFENDRLHRLDDLDAKYDLAPAFVGALRPSGVVYERGAPGEFLHAYSAPFDDRFEFEFVERRGGYELYGSINSPVRLAALTEWRDQHSKEIAS